jgi:glycosyl transferase family 11
MIVVKLIGGLGNQMFQYAAAKSLALSQNKKLQIDKSAFETYKVHQYGLNHFNIDVCFFSGENRFIKKIRSFFFKRVNYQEKEFSYDENFFELHGSPIFLTGYFQSEKYFKRYAKIIRKDFTITSPVKKSTSEMVLQMQKVNAVSIHFRRGDYVGNALHETQNDAYYRKAVSLIETKIENPVFYVFSDDIFWAKQNFAARSKIIFVDFNDALSNFEDIMLMSNCKHNIITNSSFSWWGAWLNTNPEKVVIAPDLWFNDQAINTIDLIPENWIRF